MKKAILKFEEIEKVEFKEKETFEYISPEIMSNLWKHKYGLHNGQTSDIVSTLMKTSMTDIARVPLDWFVYLWYRGW